MTRILVINGSYRVDGITDQTIKIMADHLRSLGAEVEMVALRDCPIEFCLNCRECTQKPGYDPGGCVLHDGMGALVEMIEQSDGYVLASPTNFGSVTAIYKRFMERLIVYGYWPWGAKAPKFRKARLFRKKAVVVSSSAAPEIMGRWLFSSRRQLKATADTVGANVVGGLFAGLVATEPHQKLPDRTVAKARLVASRLL